MRKWETRANLRLKPTVTDPPVALGEAERDGFLPLWVFKIPETSPNCALSRRDERERQNVAPGTGRTRHGREDAANPFPHRNGMLALLIPAGKPAAPGGCPAAPRAPRPAASPNPAQAAAVCSVFPRAGDKTSQFPSKAFFGGGGICQLSDGRREKKGRRWNFQGKGGEGGCKFAFSLVC